MKRPKDRLFRVLVIGATPSGIMATNKLGQLNIPVTLIDSTPDINIKLAREEWRLDSGLALNDAHRPGLLRIFRNPRIRCIMPARVDLLKHMPQGFRCRVVKLPTYIDPARCTLCGRCIEVCPVITPSGERPIQFTGRRSIPGRPVIDKRREPPCRTECPLGINVQAYIALTMAGKFEEALEVVRRDNVLPGICGRVCTHPCESVCRRGEIDEPLAIRDIKRFLADYELSHPRNFERIPKRQGKIAIIGSGPAGLASAADLARSGYQVTVFEKEAEAGGLLRYGIGEHRLPRGILDYEIEYIKNLDVQLITSSPVDLQNDLLKLRQNFDAVIITTGAWTDRMPGIPGEDLEGVQGCISLLSKIHRGEIKELDKKMAVIGDGNAAFDLARTIKRLGADVQIISWFPEQLIPADPEEIRGAKEEGISIIDQTRVVEFSGRDGKLNSLKCKPTRPGEPDSRGIPWPVIISGSASFDLKFDQVIIAIGQAGSYMGKEKGFDVSPAGFIDVNESYATNLSRVYAAGDAVTGPSSVVNAMAAGRAVAGSVHMELSGERSSVIKSFRPIDKDFSEISSDIPSLARPTMPEKQPSVRADNFCEVALGLSKAQVMTEAERCLQCGICSECLLCAEACSAIGAINHDEQPEEIIEHAGVVIIADPEMAPSIKGDDVIRAYGPKAAKPDVYAMIMRGFAAAAKAMILLKSSSIHPKGRGVSFSLPDPELSSDIRIGVFVCKCNDSFGWLESMDDYVKSLTERNMIVHAEVMPSACIPEGSAGILSTIREKGITRVVLASCVCCPLDFICSACTDQRSRLKDALFKGTGVSRSMVETCNLRGEALRYLKDDQSQALIHFRGLIERSINRAGKLKPLPAPVRTYNFTTAVIGQSEAAVTSAWVLAEAGFEVFMFGSFNNPVPDKLTHPNIHYFKVSTVRSFSGTLGDFQVFADSDGFSQVLQVGTVILGEKQRRLIPYIAQDEFSGSIVTSFRQQTTVPGIPFLSPGSTSIDGLFLANPPGIHISERKKGASAAVLAAAIMPRGPRQSKGYTVVVNKDICRGCGRCFEVCAYQAITFKKNSVGGWYAVVDEARCKGCGNCISVCPSNAADSPYRDQVYLEQMLEEVLGHHQERIISA